MFFFFKQKTAYEMRISDWSSDVCSSDLWLFDAMMEAHVPCAPVRTLDEVVNDPNMHARGALEWQDHPQFGRIVVQQSPLRRSEEHTSELQSLMRISYAVFCLKKKIMTTHHTHRVEKQYDDIRTH